MEGRRDGRLTCVQNTLMYGCLRVMVAALPRDGASIRGTKRVGVGLIGGGGQEGNKIKRGGVN